MSRNWFNRGSRRHHIQINPEWNRYSYLIIDRLEDDTPCIGFSTTPWNPNMKLECFRAMRDICLKIVSQKKEMFKLSGIL